MIVAALARWLRRLAARGARAVLAWSESAPARSAPVGAAPPVGAGPPPAWVALVADAAPELLDGIGPTATFQPVTTARPTARASTARIGADLRARPLRLARAVTAARRERVAKPNVNVEPPVGDVPTRDLPESRFPARTAHAFGVAAERPESAATQIEDLAEGRRASPSRPRQGVPRGRAGSPVFAPLRETGEPVARQAPVMSGTQPISRSAPSAAPLLAPAAAEPAFPLFVQRHVEAPDWPELPVSAPAETGPWTSLPESLPAVSHRRRPFAERWQAELTAE